MFLGTNFSSQRALAIETSGRNGSVALVQGDTILGQETFSHGLKHAAGLLPLIDKLMRQQNWTPDKLDYVYVSHGPGSFTGLRIGITVVKTLAFTTGAKIVAVPTTLVLVANAPADAKNVMIVLDAKREQVFTALYERRENEFVELEPAHLDDLSSMLERAGRPVTLLGEGIPFHQQYIPVDQSQIRIAPESAWVARAEVVAAIGAKMARQNLFVSADALTPLYIRKPEAEEKFDLQHPPAIPAP
jgi:tRNA threonylcarbamoyladenosine biosynthesis protein TsaB